MGRFHKQKTHIGLDKYYTKERVVRRCLDALGDLGDYDYVVDPSAGSGAFFDAINHSNKIGIDIEPESDAIQQIDWFEFRIDRQYSKVCVIGNPPFGRDNQLSHRFLLHALRFGNVYTIAFILPNTYKKHTKQKIIPLHWRIKDIIDVGKNAFYFQGEEIHIPCSFFILTKSKGRDLRFNPTQYRESAHFSFGTKHDFDIFVFGAAPKKVAVHPTQNNRGYYLKAKIPVHHLIRNIQKVEWNGNSSASGGIYWLTKPELVYMYDTAMGNTSISEPTFSNARSLFE